MKCIGISVSILFSQAFLFTPAYAQEKIVLSCATSARDSVIDKAAEAFTKETGIAIVQEGGGRRGSTSAYFKDLMDGKVEAACGSVAWDDWLKLMEKEGIAVPKDQYTARVVGKDLLYTIAHKSSGVTELNLQQLEGVISGDIKNWKQVGGADLPIVVVSSKDKANTRNSFVRMAMPKKTFRTDFVELSGVKEKLEKMETMIGAVSIFSETVKSANVVTIKTPDIGRPVTLITKGRPSPNVEKFIQFTRKIHSVN